MSFIHMRFLVEHMRLPDSSDRYPGTIRAVSPVRVKLDDLRIGTTLFAFK